MTHRFKITLLVGAFAYALLQMSITNAAAYTEEEMMLAQAMGMTVEELRAQHRQVRAATARPQPAQPAVAAPAYTEEEMMIAQATGITVEELRAQHRQVRAATARPQPAQPTTRPASPRAAVLAAPIAVAAPAQAEQEIAECCVCMEEDNLRHISGHSAYICETCAGTIMAGNNICPICEQTFNPHPVRSASPRAAAAQGGINFVRLPQESHGASPRVVHTSQYHHGGQNDRRGEDEDTHIEATSEVYDFFGVYDGHLGNRNPGYQPNTVATSAAALFAAENLHTYAAANLTNGMMPDQALVAAIAQTDTEYERLFPNNVDGCTAVVALVDKPRRTVSLARLGDARWALGDSRGNLIAASRDQKPEDDAARLGDNYQPGILEFGLPAKVNLRGEELGVSRAIGDRPFGALVSNEADAQTFAIPAGGVAILACDGLWDSAISNEAAVRMALDARSAGRNEHAAAEELYNYASTLPGGRGVRDNVSITVIYF